MENWVRLTPQGATHLVFGLIVHYWHAGHDRHKRIVAKCDCDFQILAPLLSLPNVNCDVVLGYWLNTQTVRTFDL